MDLVFLDLFIQTQWMLFHNKFKHKDNTGNRQFKDNEGQE